MLRLSELVGMRVVSRTTGRYLAVVHDLIFDKANRQAAALLVEADGSFGYCRAVPWSAIRSVGDLLVVDGRNPLVLIRDNPYLLRLMQQAVPLVQAPVIAGARSQIGLTCDLFLDLSGRLIGFNVSGGFWSLSRGRFLPDESVLALSRDGIISRTADLLPLTAARQYQSSRFERLEQPAHMQRRSGPTRLLG